MNPVRVILSGTGTSVGIPIAGCRCSVCRSPDPRDRRGRSSVILRNPAGPVAVIDTGPDFREQMLRHDIERLDAVLLTHSHYDHTAGLDDIRPYNYYSGRPIPLHASSDTLEKIRAHFDYIWNAPQNGGGLPRVELHPESGPFVAAGMRFTPLPLRHGVIESWGFRLGDFVYASDLSEIPPDTLALMAGARNLVIGAVRRAPHSTHFHLEKALDAIRLLRPERAWLTHMNHDFGHDALCRELPDLIRPAHDGLALEARDVPEA